MIQFSEKKTSELISNSKNEFFHRYLELNLVCPGRVWLAGGALRHLFDEYESVADFDMYFSNKYASAATEIALEKIEGAEVIFNCPEGKLRTYKVNGLKIQIIKEWNYHEPKEMLDNFDLKCCRFAYDGKHIYTFYSAIRDVKKKVIRINKLMHPVSTIKRFVKYGKKGYNIPTETAEEFVNFIHGKGKNLEILEMRAYLD